MRLDAPIDLVVFSAGGLWFGGYARQVREVVPVKELPALSADGCFACWHNGETVQGIDFQQWLNQYTVPARSDFGPARAGSSKLLLITPACECRYRAVRIEAIEQLLTVALDDVFTLPVLMQKMGQCSALWGVARQQNTLIPLIDLCKLQT